VRGLTALGARCGARVRAFNGALRAGLGRAWCAGNGGH
jgi:hypothetical protein